MPRTVVNLEFYEVGSDGGPLVAAPNCPVVPDTGKVVVIGGVAYRVLTVVWVWKDGTAIFDGPTLTAEIGLRREK